MMDSLVLVCIAGGIVLTVLFFRIKYILWDKPREESKSLKREIDEQKKQYIYSFDKLQKLHKEEISQLQARLQNSQSLQIQKNEFADIVVSFAWKELLLLFNEEYSFLDIPKAFPQFSWKKDEVIDTIKRRVRKSIEDQYKYQYLTYLYPELEKIFDGTAVILPPSEQLANPSKRSENLFEIVNILKSNPQRTAELIKWKNRVAFLEASKSNLKAIPYMAAIMADYETYGIEHLAKELDWGYAMKRMDKVKSIREIRKDAQAIVEKNKEAQYQLAYLLNLFPSLEDVIDAEFSQLPVIEVSEFSEYDSVRNYLSKEEYATLSTTERNQLALDRYKNSHSLTKWQIGRDYELYVGYKYSLLGFNVDYFGSYMGMEDLGRDIIATKGNEVLIVQCKYWSANKQIHEKHINQLYGTMVSYCIEHQINPENVQGILVTNIELSPMAKKMASYLGIKYKENFKKGDYPCIKCNIGHNEKGEETRIYHLPFDQQYDSTKIKNEGEFYAMTVAEAEAAGFRRAYKWFGA